MSRPNLLQRRASLGDHRRRRPHRPKPDPVLSASDAAARRAREAGGPRDHACYACTCGCLFDAAVSTSVLCPHCGRSQPW